MTTKRDGVSLHYSCCSTLLYTHAETPYYTQTRTHSAWEARAEVHHHVLQCEHVSLTPSPIAIAHRKWLCELSMVSDVMRMKISGHPMRNLRSHFPLRTLKFQLNGKSALHGFYHQAHHNIITHTRIVRLSTLVDSMNFSTRDTTTTISLSLCVVCWIAMQQI